MENALKRVQETGNDGSGLPKICETDSIWYFCGPSKSKPKHPEPQPVNPDDFAQDLLDDPFVYRTNINDAKVKYQTEKTNFEKK